MLNLTNQSNDAVRDGEENNFDSNLVDIACDDVVEELASGNDSSKGDRAEDDGIKSLADKSRTD